MEETIFLKNDIDVLTDFIHKLREKSKEFSHKFDLFIKFPYFVIKILKFEIFIAFFDRDGCLDCFLFSFLTHKKTPTNKNISTIIPTFIKLIFYPLFSCWCPLCMAQENLTTTF